MNQRKIVENFYCSLSLTHTHTHTHTLSLSLTHTHTLDFLFKFRILLQATQPVVFFSFDECRVAPHTRDLITVVALTKIEEEEEKSPGTRWNRTLDLPILLEDRRSNHFATITTPNIIRRSQSSCSA